MKEETTDRRSRPWAWCWCPAILGCGGPRSWCRGLSVEAKDFTFLVFFSFLVYLDCFDSDVFSWQKVDVGEVGVALSAQYMTQ